MKYLILTLYSLLQLACGENSSVNENRIKKWSLSVPEIVSENGEIEKINQLELSKSYNLIDKIKFSERDLLSSTELTVKSSCGFYQEEIKGELSREYYLADLLPKKALLPSKNKKEIVCDLHFKVKNKRGDQHNFEINAINLNIENTKLIDEQWVSAISDESFVEGALFSDQLSKIDKNNLSISCDNERVLSQKKRIKEINMNNDLEKICQMSYVEDSLFYVSSEFKVIKRLQTPDIFLNTPDEKDKLVVNEDFYLGELEIHNNENIGLKFAIKKSHFFADLQLKLIAKNKMKTAMNSKSLRVILPLHTNITESNSYYFIHMKAHQSLSFDINVKIPHQINVPCPSLIKLRKEMPFAKNFIKNMTPKIQDFNISLDSIILYPLLTKGDEHSVMDVVTQRFTDFEDLDYNKDMNISGHKTCEQLAKDSKKFRFLK